MHDKISIPADAWSIQLDDKTELFAFVKESFQLMIAKVDIESKKHDTCRLNVSAPYYISGLLKISSNHVLVGTRGPVICVDVRKMSECCRAHDSFDEERADEEELNDEEAIAAHGFDFDPQSRSLIILCGSYDSCVLYRYKLDRNHRKFTFKNRRDVGAGCPKGSQDLLRASGMSLIPGSSDAVAIIQLDNLIVEHESRSSTNSKKSAKSSELEFARLCWIAQFSDRADRWIEVVSRIDGDFIGGFKKELGAYQLACPEDWEPYPLPIDEHQVAFATATGKVLLTRLTSGKTICLAELHGPVKTLAWDAEHPQIDVRMVSGVHETVKVETSADAESDIGHPSPLVTVVAPRKRKRLRPPSAKPLSEVIPLSWSNATPVAMTPDATLAIAGRFVIDLQRKNTVAVLSKKYPHENCFQVGILKTGQFAVSRDQTVCLYDAHTGCALQDYGAAVHFAIRPNEQQIAIVNWRYFAVFDLHTGHELARISCQKGYRVAWHPHANVLAVCTSTRIEVGPNHPRAKEGDCFIEFWDLDRKECYANIRRHDISTIVWPLPDCLVAVTDTDSTTLQCWHPGTLESIWQVRLRKECINGLAASPDGIHVVTSSGTSDSQGRITDWVRTWDTKTGEQTGSLNGHFSDCARCVSAGDDGTFLVGEGALQLCKLMDGLVGEELGEHWSASGIALSRNGKWLVSFSFELQSSPDAPAAQAVFKRFIRLWDVEQRRCHAFIETLGSLDTQMLGDVSDDGLFVAFSWSPDEISMWNTRSKSLASKVTVTGARFAKLSISEDGARVAAACPKTRKVYVWETTSGESLRKPSGIQRDASCTAMSLDLNLVCCGFNDGHLRLWDMDSNELLATLIGHQKKVACVCVSIISKKVVSYSEDGTIGIWDYSKGNSLAFLDIPAAECCLQLILSPDESKAVARFIGCLWVIDLTSCKPILAIPVSATCVGIDDKALVTVNDCEVQLWPCG